MRTIKIYSTVGTSGAVETAVTTLGELKPLLAAKGITYSGMKLLIGETRNELSMDESVLPEGDFKLYLMPEKTKSGGKSIKKRFNKIVDTFKDLGTQINELGELLAEKDAKEVQEEIQEEKVDTCEDVCAGSQLSTEDKESIVELRKLFLKKLITEALSK